jgi:hypothetical protein
MRFVEPKTFLIGHTTACVEGIRHYLDATGQLEFLQAFNAAVEDGLSPEEHGETGTGYWSHVFERADPLETTAGAS